jgi:hypothetical protein
MNTPLHSECTGAAPITGLRHLERQIEFIINNSARHVHKINNFIIFTFVNIITMYFVTTLLIKTEP